MHQHLRTLTSLTNLLYMAIFDLIGMVVSLCISIITNILVGNPPYWNILIIFGVYCTINWLFHRFFKFQCRSYRSGPNPKHLIVIIPGYLGHFIPCKGLLDSFKQRFSSQDDILVHVIRSNADGFFCYTFCKTNDGIHNGSTRIAQEITFILHENSSIHKLSIIGCSLGGVYAQYCLSLLCDSNKCIVNGKEIELMNLITLATPHRGVVDGFGSSKCCFCCGSTYNAVIRIKKYGCCGYECCSKTMCEMMLLDHAQILHTMSTGQRFLAPLRLFENRICYGNGHNDSRVSCASALRMDSLDCDGNTLGLQYWNRMKQRGDAVLIEELNENSIDLKVHRQQDKTDASGLSRGTRANTPITWRRVVVCFDFKDPHTLLNTPPIGKPNKSKEFLDAFHANFVI